MSNNNSCVLPDSLSPLTPPLSQGERELSRVRVRDALKSERCRSSVPSSPPFSRREKGFERILEMS